MTVVDIVGSWRESHGLGGSLLGPVESHAECLRGRGDFDQSRKSLMGKHLED